MLKELIDKGFSDLIVIGYSQDTGDFKLIMDSCFDRLGFGLLRAIEANPETLRACMALFGWLAEVLLMVGDADTLENREDVICH